ncbi:MAG TPA: hypothetical protein VGE35_01865 [Candidatus Paceibacterota bacterium]
MKSIISTEFTNLGLNRLTAVLALVNQADTKLRTLLNLPEDHGLSWKFAQMAVEPAEPNNLFLMLGSVGRVCTQDNQLHVLAEADCDIAWRLDQATDEVWFSQADDSLEGAVSTFAQGLKC